jgi:hypothetical protein
MPVTTAEKSPIVLGFFVTKLYSLSPKTAEATDKATISRLYKPKMTVEATSGMLSAMITCIIILFVVSGFPICGDEDTKNFDFIFPSNSKQE